MACTLRWRKAIALSIFVHLFFWGVVGYVSAWQPVSPVVSEKTVELDLIGMADEVAAAEPEPLPPQPQPEERPPEPLPDPEAIPEKEPIPLEDVKVPIEPPVEKPAAPVVAKPQVKHGPMATPPSVILKVDPVYPSSARPTAAKYVVLKVTIQEDGLPGKIVVVGTSGQKVLDEAAIASLKKWRFLPAKDGEGIPMPCYTIVRVPIVLK
jgi:protein TonB